MSAQDVIVAPAIQPPSPPRWRSLLGAVHFFTRDRILNLQEVHRLYGDFVLSRLGRSRFYFIANPDAIQECLVAKHKDFQKSRSYFALRLVMGNGLVTSEGDFHLRQRRMIQPAFHRDRIREFGEAMVAFAAQARNEYQAGQRYDINRSMMRVTLFIVAKALFNSDVTADAKRIGKALDTLMHMDAVFLNPFGPLISKLPLPINARRKRMVADIDEVIYRMIADRRASGDQGDLMSMLLAARDEDDGTGMTDVQVRDEAVTLFLAGHETTANALTWTWLLLSQHPEIEAKFHEELDRVLGGREPSPDDYPQLTYTRQVVAESMRLYPPVWAFAREATADTTVGGYTLPAGSQLVICSHVVHHNPELYPDPEKFDPERFSPENSAGRHKFAYFPFGGGRRLCIGEGFAWMEGVLVLATIGQKWKFRVDPTHPIVLDPHITLRPKGGLPMFAEPR